MTDKEKKHLQEIQNVPVDEKKLRNDRKNAVSFKQETTYELTLELMDIERKKAESSIDTLEVKEVDLEKELNKLNSTLYDMDGVAIDDDTNSSETRYITVEDVKDIAKHFFELGIKAAQKGK